MPRLRVEVDHPCVTEGVTFEERPGGRFCHSCNEMQHDLRDATQREALALIEAHGGRLCGIFRAGPGGQVQFRPEKPSRVGQAARGAAMALALAGCGSSGDTSPTASPPTSIALTPTPPASAPPPPTAETPPPPATPTAAPLAEDDAELHATDASADPDDHRTHEHSHEPVALSGSGVGIGIGSIGLSHISGGASAVPMLSRGPSCQLHVFADQITSTGPGTFDRELLVRMIRRRQSAIRACYERELRTTPTLEGQVAISMTIGDNGAIRDVSVVRSADGFETVTACAVRVIESIRFDHGPEGGTISYTVPLAFDSAAL